MHYLRTASFGGLFTVTFAVAASFQVVFSVLGLFLAVAAPGMFNMNGVPATSAVGAIGVLIFMLAFGLFYQRGDVGARGSDRDGVAQPAAQAGEVGRRRIGVR